MTVLETDPPPLHAAFRDVHGARLHGFALLVLNGDAAAAATLATEVLEAHLREATSLRHPERAAAVLRAALLRRAEGLRRPGVNLEERESALATVGVDRATVAALGRLRPRGRAAIAAADVERFGPEDLSIILGRSARQVRRDLDVSRRAYLAAFRPEPRTDGGDDVGPGRVTARIAHVAARALGSVSDEIGA